MKDNKISVIVPIYNVEKYLRRCIDSIINQTYKNLEIILVNDGSPDNCGVICDEYSNKDERIKVIHKKNGGLSDARNAGLEIATGSYIGYVDSDDWIEPNMYEDLINVISYEDSDIASCMVNKIWDEKDVINVKYEDELNIITLNTEDALAELIKEKLLTQTVWNKLYRREIISDIIFEYGKFHEDEFWSYRIIANAKKISIINKGYYNYFQRDTSIMGEGYSLKRLDALDALESRYRFIKNKFSPLTMLAIKSYISSCMYQYQCICRSNDIDLKTEGEKNIEARLNSLKIENKKWIFEKDNIKQDIWLFAFITCPKIVCKLRNKLKIGL